MERVNPVERRQYSRVPLDITIEIYHIHDGNTEMPPHLILCRGRDLSEGGISFLGTDRYEHGNLLRLQIPLQLTTRSKEDGGKSLKVMGKVMWCQKQTDTGHYLTGVQFLNIYDQDFDLLNDYVQSQMEKK